MKIKKFVLLGTIACIISGSFFSFVHAQSTQIISGLSWLSANQNQDGSWSGVSTTNFVSTTEVLSTFAALSNKDTVYTNGLNWLSTQSVDTTDYLAKRITILGSSYFTSDLSTMLSYKYVNGGWSGYLEYTSNNLDTSLTLLALKSANYTDTTVITNAISYLLSNQNPDGGFGFYSGDGSNVYMTSLVSWTLQQFPQTTSIATAVNKATSYLISQQQTNGGWGSVYETAHAYIALVAVSTDATVLGNAINYLTTSQSPDGSWNQDPYSTALALRALSNVKPNLAITTNDITFSNPAPTVGDTITITANIKNAGPLQAENVVVQFYTGDPSVGGVLIGETTVLSIPAYGISQTGITWAIPSVSGGKIFVRIDPLNGIDEISETDNLASRNLTSATLPDLSIASADIAFNPSAPAPGEAVTIIANVRNLGETGAGNVTVDFYDGAPSSGGMPIGTATISSITPGGTAVVQLTTSFTSESHDISITVDKANSIPEGSEANNSAVKTLSVGGGIDLSITGSDITFNPANPVEESLVTINAAVHNEGETGANNILVRFYLGDPDAGGSQIGSDITIPSILARGTTTISAIWDTTGHQGSKDIYIKIDPLNAIPEANKFNNKAFRTAKVAVKTGPDMTLTSADINFTPIAPNAGDIVTITATIRNSGTTDANNVPVEFSLGDPNAGGTLIIGSQTIPFIAKGSSATVQITWNTTGFSGNYEIYVNADPFNAIAEMSETNNTAHVPITITAPQGPDITVTSIDTTNLITDTQNLTVSGSIKINLENKGNLSANAPFEITAFEDRNQNKKLDADIDNILGKATYTGSLLTGATDVIDIPLSGNVLFRDNLIYAIADSSSLITELDETNNMRNTGQQCEYRPPVGTFSPVEKWRWAGSSVLPEYNQAMHTPAVARIVDTNKDGLIDGNDVPAVIFTSYFKSYISDGVLRAVRGDNGQEIFSVANPLYRINPSAALAVGDIDNDGLVEIVAAKSGGGIIVFENDGTFKWSSEYGSVSILGGSSIADLDNDGEPEIVVGNTVLNNNSTLRWQGAAGVANNAGYGPFSILADIDLDGSPEIIAGNTVYRNNGATYWENAAIGDGYNAVANFDDDPYPEIVLVSSGNVYMLRYNGAKIWGPVAIPAGGRGGAPTIADFDGDGKPEIGVAGAGRYVVIDSDGSLLWQSVINDYSSNLTGSSVFDFEGDGKAEAIYNDEYYLRVYKGSSGQVLFQTPNPSGTHSEYPLIVDVDNDNRAEIVVVANILFGGTIYGIRVFEDANDNWVNTRKIWNQHTYHITNVNDDGTIPRYEQNNWGIFNNYRCNSLLPEEVLGTADITTSYITVDQTNYPTSATLSVRIGNGGAVSQIAGVDVAFYDGEPNLGGILIGTVKTTKTLDAGGYEDISVTWNAPASGNHTIYIIADKLNKFNECRENNNTASAEATIGITTPPVYLPDLSISASDVAIASAMIEGQPAIITATVHSIGNMGASDVIISFYDGDPKSGGMMIGSLTQSSIDSGASAIAEVSWNTFGQSGRNYIHVTADPQNSIAESHENNNSAIIPVDITSPSKPDLAITSSDITFSNLIPQEGDQLIINATIHNRGLDVSDIEVYLSNGNPSSGGVLLSQKTISQIIPFGGTVVLGFDVNTIGFAGAHNFYISIDPNNRIDEIIDTNNIAGNSLTIGSSGASMGVSLDKGAYTANENCLIDLSIANTSSFVRTLDVVVEIEDSIGNPIQTVATLAGLHFTAGETKNFLDIIFNTGKTFADNYRVHAKLIEAGKQIGESFANFAILPVKQASSTIASDKIAYSSYELVTLTSIVTSQSPNSIITDLDVTVDVTDPQGTLIFTETRTLSDLLPEARIEFKSFTNTGAYLAGIYTASLKVRSNGGSLTSATTTFEILSSLTQANALAGTISANPGAIFEKESTILSYTIQNIGNDIDLPLIQTEILVVDPDTQLSVRTITGEASLNEREVFSNSTLFDSTGLAPKPYLIVLRATTAGVTQTLNSTGLIINPIPNNAPIANAGADQSAFAGQPVLLDGSASSDPDGDPVFFTWRFTLVPNASQTTDNSLSNHMTPTPSFVPDAEGIYTLSLKVNDGLADSQTDTVSVFVNPPAKVDIHPETINLKSNGGSKSITGVLTSPVLSSFEFFTAEDGVTVTANFSLENRYIDKNGNEVIFTIPAEDYPGDDKIEPVDADGDGDIDLYQLTLKFNRDMFIAGFRDASGQLRITQATELTSTVIGNSTRVGSDVNTVISPLEVGE